MSLKELFTSMVSIIEALRRAITLFSVTRGVPCMKELLRFKEEEKT